MNKKLFLKIQAFILMLLIILTTLVIPPQHIKAATIIAGDEESAEVVADNSTSANENLDSALSANSSDEQNDLEQVAKESESSDIPFVSDNEEAEETDVIPPDDRIC
ncbi:MAG TPA: hypothetical protein GXZ43_01980 [Clostridiaceae bacterium]|nr:hypothetical protein [Clostridiaceae bacterium]